MKMPNFSRAGSAMVRHLLCSSRRSVSGSWASCWCCARLGACPPESEVAGGNVWRDCVGAGASSPLGATVWAQGRQALPVGPRVSTALAPYRSRQGHGSFGAPLPCRSDTSLPPAGVLCQSCSAEATGNYSRIFLGLRCVGHASIMAHMPPRDMPTPDRDRGVPHDRLRPLSASAVGTPRPRHFTHDH